MIAIVALLLAITSRIVTAEDTPRHNISAIFAFGDSTFDSGNNNWRPTLVRANHVPYGCDFPDSEATGRFSDGRLITDFLVSSLGIKDLLPPYSHPSSLTPNDLTTGVSFASAGSGLDNQTANSVRATTIDGQVAELRNYDRRVRGFIGDVSADWLMRDAMFLVSAGSNDMMNYYASDSTRKPEYNVSAYHDFLLQSIESLIQKLYGMRGRKFMVLGLPPIGCLPYQMTKNSLNLGNSHFGERVYGKSQNDDAINYNNKLQALLTRLQSTLQGSKIAYIDIFNPLMEMVWNPRKHGFAIATEGCCGTGLIEMGLTCSSSSGSCDHPSDYVFWDAVHPSEAANKKLAKAIMDTISTLFSNPKFKVAVSPSDSPATSPSYAPTTSPVASPSSAQASPVASPTPSSGTSPTAPSSPTTPLPAPPFSPAISPAGPPSPSFSPIIPPSSPPSPTTPPSLSPTTSPSASPTVSPSSPTASPSTSPSSSPAKPPSTSPSPTPSPLASPSLSPLSSPIVSPSSPSPSPYASPITSPSPSPSHVVSPSSSLSSPTTSPSSPTAPPSPTMSPSSPSLSPSSPLTSPIVPPSSPSFSPTPIVSPYSQPLTSPTTPPSSPSFSPTAPPSISLTSPTMSPSPSSSPSSPLISPTMSPSSSPSSLSSPLFSPIVSPTMSPSSPLSSSSPLISPIMSPSSPPSSSSPSFSPTPTVPPSSESPSSLTSPTVSLSSPPSSPSSPLTSPTVPPLSPSFSPTTPPSSSSASPTVSPSSPSSSPSSPLTSPIVSPTMSPSSPPLSPSSPLTSPIESPSSPSSSPSSPSTSPTPTVPPSSPSFSPTAPPSSSTPPTSSLISPIMSPSAPPSSSLTSPTMSPSSQSPSPSSPLTSPIVPPPTISLSSPSPSPSPSSPLTSPIVPPSSPLVSPTLSPSSPSSSSSSPLTSPTLSPSPTAAPSSLSSSPIVSPSSSLASPTAPPSFVHPSSPTTSPTPSPSSIPSSPTPVASPFASPSSSPSPSPPSPFSPVVSPSPLPTHVASPTLSPSCSPTVSPSSPTPPPVLARHNITAVFAFGDSTVDSGKNNWLPTYLRANHPPYGRDFPNGVPTGRFSNGRLITDFLISSLKLKDLLPPYTFQTAFSLADNLTTGVSFASAGSGFDSATAMSAHVSGIDRQLADFRTYNNILQKIVGNQSNQVIKDAVFIVSAGFDDMLNYYTPFFSRRLDYDISGYQVLLLQSLQSLIKELYEVSARKFIITGLPPIGCTPLQITRGSISFGSGQFGKRVCVENQNDDSTTYNTKLQALLTSMQSSLQEVKIVYADLYSPLMDMIQNPSKHGFTEATKGCCGTGLFETDQSCRWPAQSCSDPSKYVFWDSVHLSQAANEQLAKGIMDTVIPNLQ